MVGTGVRGAVRQRARRWTAVFQAVPSAAVTDPCRRDARCGSGGEAPRGGQPPRSYARLIHHPQERTALPRQPRAGRGREAGRTGGGAAGALGMEACERARIKSRAACTNQEHGWERPEPLEAERQAGRTEGAGEQHALSPALSLAAGAHARALSRGASPPTPALPESTGRPTVGDATPPTERSSCPLLGVPQRTSNTCAEIRPASPSGPPPTGGVQLRRLLGAVRGGRAAAGRDQSARPATVRGAARRSCAGVSRPARVTDRRW